MAPRAPDDISEHESRSGLESDGVYDAVSSEPSQLPNERLQDENFERIEETDHTEEPKASLSVDKQDKAIVKQDEIGTRSESSAQDPPLLPAELLKPLPSPADSPRNAVAILEDQTTHGEKNSNRHAKKRVRDWLREETKGTGVLEAGRVAQLRRGVVPVKDRVRKGRIEKNVKVKVSGRQRLLEQRKRVAEEKGKRFLGPTKKGKRKGKP